MSYSPLPQNPFSTPPANGGGESSSPLNAVFGSGSYQIPRLRVAGNAPVFVHWSVVILLGFVALLVWPLSGGIADVSTLTRVLVTLLSPLFFLLSIFAHELAHAYTFFSLYGVWVVIYLYAMGGLTTPTTANLDAANSAKKSLPILVAIAGPAVNGLLGGVLLTAYYLSVGSFDSPLLSFLLWFHGWAQIGLAVYNMLPGVPLDGSNALVGLIRLCATDGKAKLIAYSIGCVVLVAAIVLTCIFLSLSTGIFLILSLLYTCFALYDVYQREKPPQSLTNPTY